MMNIFRLLLILFSIQLYSQEVADISSYNSLDSNSGKYFKDLNNYYSNFIGTWRTESGNQTFLVTFFKVAQVPYPSPSNPEYYMDEIQGHYKIIQNEDLPNEIIVCTSEKNYPNSSQPWSRLVLAFSSDGVNLTGTITDNCTTSAKRPLEGKFKFILNSATSGSWEVVRFNGIRPIGEPDFKFPTFASLLKIN